jgi:hypothetical protein
VVDAPAQAGSQGQANRQAQRAAVWKNCMISNGLQTLSKPMLLRTINADYPLFACCRAETS